MKVLLAAAAVSAAADTPYLPASGPVPLRFSHPVVRKTSGLQLPPLATVDPRPPEKTPPATSHTNTAANPPPDPHAARSVSEPAGSTNATATGPIPTGSEPIVVPPQFSPVVTNGIEVVRPDTENLTPQMFMRFFTGRPGTNSSGLSIIAPMPFVPPAPPAPSSTATYQSTPAPKP